MRAIKWHDLDISIIISRDELSKIEEAVRNEKDVEICTARLERQEKKPGELNEEQEISLRYSKSRECVDTSEITRNIGNDIIPVYISDRALLFLRKEGFVRGGYLSAKVEIKIEK